MKLSLAFLGLSFADDFHASLQKTNTKRYDARYEETTEEYWREFTRNDIYSSLKKKRIEKS